MIVVSRFDVPDGSGTFEVHAQEALEVLSQKPGFVRGRLGRAVDDESMWALVTEWDSVGSYRRGLGAYDVKLVTAPLMVFSVPEAGAYEVVATRDEPQRPLAGPSNRAR